MEFARFEETYTRNALVRFVPCNPVVMNPSCLITEDLLRRVSHDCVERGLLLQRVRDEARLTLDAYRTVFEGSVDYVTNTAWQDDAEIAAQREYVTSPRTLHCMSTSIQSQMNVTDKEGGRRCFSSAKSSGDFARSPTCCRSRRCSCPGDHTGAACQAGEIHQ